MSFSAMLKKFSSAAEMDAHHLPFVSLLCPPPINVI
jgi:hypothetical protein